MIRLGSDFDALCDGKTDLLFQASAYFYLAL